MKENAMAVSASKRKYLLLSEIFPPKTGGSGRWFWDLYTRLGKEGTIIVTDIIDDAEDTDSQSGLDIYRIPLSSNSWGIKSLKGLRFYFSAIRHVLKLVKKHKIESIHCGRTLHEGVIGLVVKYLTGTPYLCYVHGEDIEMCWSSREFVFLVNAVLKNSDLLICNSHNSAKLLDKWSGASKEKVRVLHPGVDASVFRPSDDETRDPTRKIILTVSRLQPRKGHDVLISAMPEILKVHPDLHYVIVGSGDQYEHLKNQVEKLDLKDHVSLLGECSDEEILYWYQKCDLFVLPNRTIGNDVEGFGIVLLEAQACAKAVIAGDSGGTRETMEVGKTGYIIDCRTTELLSEAIIGLFDDPEKLDKMGKDARQYIMSRFDWPAVVDTSQSIFDEVVS